MNKSLLLLLFFLLVSSCVYFSKYDFEGYYWKLTSIEGEEVANFDKKLLSKKNPHLVFASSNRVTGFTSCNNINARFNRKKNVINFFGVVTTKNKCSKKQLEVEKSFVYFLNVAEYMIVNGNNLTIYNKNKDIVLVFKKEYLPSK